MADKTPLELAREVMAESSRHTHVSQWARDINTVAAALVERLTPVKAAAVSNTWKCGGCSSVYILWYHKFCSSCGKPLVWK